MTTAAVTPIAMPAIVPGGVGGGSVGSVIKRWCIHIRYNNKNTWHDKLGDTQNDYSLLR